MNFFDNITSRKKRTQSMTDHTCSESSSDNSKLDGTSCSLPNLSGDENNIQIQKLKEQIEHLTLQLNSAHEEINNLSIENHELKKTVQGLASKHEVLKKATKKLTNDVDTPKKSLKVSTPLNKSTRKKQNILNKISSTPITQKPIADPTMTQQDNTAQINETTNIKLKQARKKICIISANKTNKNIAGFLNKSDVLTVHIQELLNIQIDIDVLCITEHFIMSGHEKLIQISNYKLATCYSRNVKRGGACILIKKCHEYTELPDIMKYSITGIIECCAIKLIKQNTIILCIYRPPKICNIDKFYENLDSILKKVCNNRKSSIIICGDFNIDILKRNRLAIEFEYFLLSYNLKLEINQPTRLDSNTCLDNFAHNLKQKCKCEVIDLALSDHTAQILKIYVNKSRQTKYWRKTIRDTSNENINKFNKYLQQLSFSDVYSTDDPNNAYDSFIDLFLLLYILCFPFKSVIVRSEKSIKWVSRGIRICSKRQRHLLWQKRLKPTYENKNNFYTYSRRFKKIIKLTQKAQNNHLIQNSKNKSKKSWQIINNSKKNTEPISQIKKDNLLITNPKEIAESFNNFFIDQITDIPKTVSDNIKKINYNPHSIFITPTVPQDIIRIIQSLKNKKSFGYDGISTQVIKSVCNSISGPLSHIINVSILAGMFPERLKTVIVKPLYKKNNKEDMSNYRPIALLPVFSKVMEKVIYESIYAFLAKFNILCDEQNGFRKNKNVNMAGYDLLKRVMASVDTRTPICAIYTDMSKAFDYVNHDILLQKLNAYGIRGNILNLIKSYLIGRKQCTEIASICNKYKRECKYVSSYREIKFGVPQGSVLGPLLFLLYINDLPSQIHHPMVLFADESTALIKCLNKDSYESDINTTIKTIINWLNYNNLLINIKKTKIMHFYQKIRTEDLNINYNCQIIEREFMDDNNPLK
ncbi:unnamed protein product [Parnassius mnemosyne]|uniref:Reverse transcriptase domain-containing protein n=1 Tax=Parnassius mnemosyne TaxID=213953 RepID=A0AAV1LRW5_9NEOP